MKTVIIACGSFSTPRAFKTKRKALLWFLRTASQLALIGQEFTATLHYGDKDTFSDCPDAILSLGPRGGLRIER